MPSLNMNELLGQLKALKLEKESFASHWNGKDKFVWEGETYDELDAIYAL